VKELEEESKQMNTLVKDHSNYSGKGILKTLNLAKTLNLGNDYVMQYLVATLAIATCTYVCFLGGRWISQDDSIMLYFATTYLLAYRMTLGPALWASLLSLILFDYFITPPVFQIDFTHALPFSTMLFMILLTSKLSARLRNYTNSLESMVQERTKELASINTKLSEEVEKHKITEDNLRRTVVELGRSNAMLQQFARIASHDLQEPLRAMQGCVDLLHSRYDEIIEEKDKEFLDYIVDGAVRMERLIKGILEHASVTYNTKRFEYVDLEKALSDACANLQQRIEETGAVVTHDALPRLMSNGIQLTQLFQNLMGNALKFQKGDVTPRIHISCKKEDSSYVFAVEDNGIGIEPKYQEQVFGMFKRLHSSQQYPGSGLGLAICKAIVDQHDGKIWVESEPGIGSRFCFSIPTVQK
jgi:K+-sensing histidine kinase KdpD